MPPKVQHTIADIPAALLVGGLATRLWPITHMVPKALVEVAGRPFIDYQLKLLHRHGIRRVVLCLGHLGEQVADYVGDGSRFGLHVEHSFDGDKLLGTGGALRRALRLLSETCWVMYGDSYMDIDYRAVLSAFEKTPALGLMTVLRNNNRWDTSNAVFRDGKLMCYDKKRPVPEMAHVDYGVSLFRRSALERIPQQSPHDLADLMRDLVNRGEMIGFEVHSRFYEIGSHEGLRETSDYLRSAAECSRELNPGQPRLGVTS